MRLTKPLITAALIAAAAPVSAQNTPPHAWLFGAWTGGLFPVPQGLTLQACLSQPVILFTRDVVLRATLTDNLYTQRVVETARTNPGNTEFRFAPAASAPEGNALLGLTAPPPATGFGCENPNVLHVQRRSDNEITFPGCPEFAYPLVRCTGR